jgi:hypothetical protein
MQEQLELSGMCRAPQVQIRRIGRRELVQLDREERAAVGAELNGTNANHRHVEVLGENGVEFGDATGPRVQVVPGDTVGHQWGRCPAGSARQPSTPMSWRPANC